MTSARARFAIDVLILIFLTAAIFIDLTGGFYTEPFGMRISARRPDRPLLVALLLGFVRWRWLRSAEFLGRPVETYRRWWHRVYTPQEDAAGETGSNRRSRMLAVGGLIVVAAAALYGQLVRLTSVPDLGDPLFSMWRMGWIYQQLLGDPRPLFDANIFHPLPLTLTLSDSMLLPSLAAAPLFAAGLHPIVVYNMLLLAAFPLSGIATFALVRRLTGSAAAAFAGGLLYMLHPYRFEHLSHFELQMTMWMPPALLAAIRFGETCRFRYALAAAVCASAQLYSSMYYGVYFPIYLAAVLVVLAKLKRWEWRRLIRPAAVSAALAMALAVPLARPYLAAQKFKGDRDSYAVEFYSADLSDYLRPHPRLAVHGGRWLADIHPERALFPGLTPLLLTAVALVPPLGPVRAAFAAGLALSYDMTRGMKGMLYPALYRTLPPIRGMRVPARFSIILGISLAVLSAYGVRRLLAAGRPGWRRRLVFAGIVTLIAIDLRPSFELQQVWTDIPGIYQDLAGRPDVVLAEIPVDQHDPWITDELPYMYFSIWHGRQMVNGYSGFIPDGQAALTALARAFPDDASIAVLRMRGVTHVTVNCAFIDGDCDAFLAKVDRRTELKLIRSAEWQGRPTRLYELRRE